jgi:hypothetical protein
MIDSLSSEESQREPEREPTPGVMPLRAMLLCFGGRQRIFVGQFDALVQ